MDLRWRLALVTGAGRGLGRDVALRLGRAGAGVLAVDADLGAAEETAELVRQSRVHAWAFQADVGDVLDRELLGARCRDLGGADLMVNGVGAWEPLTASFLAGLEHRRGRLDQAGTVVNVVPDASLLPAPAPGEDDAGACVSWLVSADAAQVLRLLRQG